VPSLRSVVLLSGWAAWVVASMSGCSLGLGGEEWGVDEPEAGSPASANTSSDAESDAATATSDDAADDAPGDDASSVAMVIPPTGSLTSSADAGHTAPSPDSGGAVPPTGPLGDGGSSATCTKLGGCCPLLAFVAGGAYTSSCTMAVSTDNVSSCQSFLSAFQSFGFCL